MWSVSIDSGKAGTWHCIPAPDTTSVYAAQFTSPVKGWAFGTHGAIYKYNSAIIGIGNNQNIFPVVSQLFQNYPNPFNPSTSIKIYLAKTSQTKLAVYDLLGREVKVLLDEIKNKGTYSVDFNASDLPSGVYFYQLESVSFKESKKMVLMK